MAIARTRAIALLGIEGHVVDVEASTTPGVPGLHLVGLPDSTLSGTRDRIRAALYNSAVPWPDRHVTVSLFPASLPKHGSGFDLAVAVAVLAANNAVPARACEGMVLIGELGLEGRVQPVPGVLPAVLAAAAAGATQVVVPRGNAAEAALVPDIAVIPVASLRGLLARLRGEPQPSEDSDTAVETAHPGGLSGVYAGRVLAGVDLADVHGQPGGRSAVEIAAAGGHHLALVGAVGSGATMLAERLPGLLPDLDHDAALEVSAIHSIAGSLPPGQPLITRPPYVAPHHTASRAAVLGGATSRHHLLPGVVSLAHHGVLHLDGAPEFQAGILHDLLAPLEDGTVTLHRGGITATLPARPITVLSAHPCPCGAPTPHECGCPPGAGPHYLARLTRSLLDRVAIKVRLTPPTRTELRHDLASAESTHHVAERVQAARDRAAHRLAELPWRTNADIPGRELRRRFAPPHQTLDFLNGPLSNGLVTERGLDHVLRSAWTLADLAGRDAPTAREAATALRMWNGLTEHLPA